MRKIKIKRVYEKPSDDDGYRILTDRIWPRGIKKEDAKLDGWNKEIAPSTELRKWFGHKQEHFAGFAKRYKEELGQKKDKLDRLKDFAEKHKVCLLYGAKNKEINHARILKQVLLKDE